MNTEKKITVIIPAFNRAELLLKTLKSLNNQVIDRKLFRVTVVDDGSTPELQPLLSSELNDVNYELSFLRQTNKGPAAARNLGIKNASSPILAFTDSDVIVDPMWLENSFTYLSEHPDVSAVEGQTIIPDKHLITPFTHQTENTTGGRYPTCNFICRAGLAKFSEDYKSNFREDSDFAFQLLEKNHKISFIKDVIVYHPVLKGSFSTPIKLARRYEYDPLLKSKFPRLYSETLDRHKILGVEVSHLRKKVYALYLCALILFIAGSIISNSLVFTLLIFLVLSYFLVFYMLIRPCSMKATGMANLALSVLMAGFIPLIVYFSILKGKLRF
jgi:glycosyltransferase involved in cell wall biosynthesis